MKNLENKNGKKIKILVIEDDKFLRDLLVRKLTDEGFESIVAIDGNEALDKIKSGSPDLILLDLIIPGIDGFNLLKQIKSDSLLNKIPVIILSNLGQQEEIERGLGLGAVDYLVKAHLTPDEIISKIKKVLG